MLKAIILSGGTLLASAGVSLGAPSAPSPAALRFTLAPAPVATAAVPADVPGHAARTPRRFTRAADGLFYVSALVNGTPVRFVVDTGSNIVVLTERDAARVGMAPVTSHSAAIETVGGAARMQRGTLDRIDIAGQSLDDVDAAVVEDGLGVSLLGQSALSHLESIRFAGDHLDLN